MKRPAAFFATGVLLYNFGAYAACWRVRALITTAGVCVFVLCKLRDVDYKYVQAKDCVAF